MLQPHDITTAADISDVKGLHLLQFCGECWAGEMTH